MNDPQSAEGARADANQEEMMSVLFAGMVVQQTNMALMLLGRMPHPETGETVRDVEGAKMFIDQLEMLEFKTKGNLNPREDKLLKQSLTSLRMAFVAAIDGAASEPASRTSPAAGAAEKTPSAAPSSASTGEDESRKKFTKKY